MSESLSVSDQQCLVGFPLLERGCHYMAFLKKWKKNYFQISENSSTYSNSSRSTQPSPKIKTKWFFTFHDQRYLVDFPCHLKHRYRLPFSVTMCKITLFIWSTICTKQQSLFVKFIICWHRGITADSGHAK